MINIICIFFQFEFFGFTTIYMHSIMIFNWTKSLGTPIALSLAQVLITYNTPISNQFIAVNTISKLKFIHFKSFELLLSLFNNVVVEQLTFFLYIFNHFNLSLHHHFIVLLPMERCPVSVIRSLVFKSVWTKFAFEFQLHILRAFAQSQAMPLLASSVRFGKFVVSFVMIPMRAIVSIYSSRYFILSPVAFSDLFVACAAVV